MQRIAISTHSITSSRPVAEGGDSRFVSEHDLDRLLHIEAFAVSAREGRSQVGGLFSAPNPIALTVKRSLLICRLRRRLLSAARGPEDDLADGALDQTGTFFSTVSKSMGTKMTTDACRRDRK